MRCMAASARVSKTTRRSHWGHQGRTLPGPSTMGCVRVVSGSLAPTSSTDLMPCWLSDHEDSKPLPPDGHRGTIIRLIQNCDDGSDWSSCSSCLASLIFACTDSGGNSWRAHSVLNWRSVRNSTCALWGAGDAPADIHVEHAQGNIGNVIDVQ